MTRTCKFCGHVTESTNYRCEKCKNIFDMQFCTKCKQWLPITSFYATTKKIPCKTCELERRRAMDPAKNVEYTKNTRAKRKEQAEMKYAYFKDLLLKVHKQPMTEIEWAEVCTYFNGCAICGEEHIEKRSFFIKVQDGGKYSKFNIFPTCAKCDLSLRRVPNPFTFFDSIERPQLQKKGSVIVMYLQDRLEAEARRLGVLK